MRRQYDVGPGWWKLLDDELPRILAVDPDLKDLDIKEKYGRCVVSFWPTRDAAVLHAAANAIEDLSAIVCENCGAPRLPSKWYPWCDRCKAASPAERSQIRQETKTAYLKCSL